ncbi:hypothetical protein [Tardiphaga sp.]|jgi:hypothetical protein|nr:hypothetical protein [Tardiphaga sp.]MBC7577401.1 hypothetical protein [Tardiphaga sp.]
MSDRHLLHEFMTGKSRDKKVSEAQIIWVVRGTVAALGAISVVLWFL